MRVTASLSEVVSILLAAEESSSQNSSPFAAFSILLLPVVGFVIYMVIKSSKEESKEVRSIKALAPSVQMAVSQMDTITQNAFFNEYERKKKSRTVTYIAWLLCGWHYLYTGNVGLQFAFWFTSGGCGVWWLVDLFRVPSIVRGYNEKVARDTIQTLAAGNQFFTNNQGNWAPPASP